MSENIYAVRTNQLRSRMQQEDLRAYLIPMNDFHGSEYIGCLLYTSDAADD